MYHRWPALVLVLALCAVQARQAAGQDTLTQPRGRTQSFLGQNYPNPFKPDTHIPFTVGGCEGAVTQRVVTIRIYNVLAQLVAVPFLEGTLGAQPKLQRVLLPCGEYSAYWDGKTVGSRRHAAPGVYLIELVLDSERPRQRKAIVAK